MTKKAKKVSRKQLMINWVKATGKDGCVEDRGHKYYAGIRGNVIRVQEYSADSECEMLLNDYCIAL